MTSGGDPVAFTSDAWASASPNNAARTPTQPPPNMRHCIVLPGPKSPLFSAERKREPSAPDPA